MCIMTRDLEVLQQIFPIKTSGGKMEGKDGVLRQLVCKGIILILSSQAQQTDVFFFYSDKLVMFGR